MKNIYVVLTMLSVALFESNPARAQSTTFSYTTSVIQTYTVPAGVTTLNIMANGAQGGDYLAPLYVGGLGITMNCSIAVIPGHVLSILVGQQGGISAYCAGGGGGTFVWDASAATTPLVAAGGGGGASSTENGIEASTTTSGTNGGGGTTYADGGAGGIGGTIPAGAGISFGAGGCGWLTNGANGSPGPVIVVGITIAGGGTSPNPSLTPGTGAGGASGGTSAGSGGFGGGGGGQIAGTSTVPSGGGGGGGGGYSGGGGGAGTPVAGGGGGGSYCSGSISSIAASNTGNGLVVITAPCTVGAITGDAPVCAGATEGLSDALSGGTWVSTNTSIATINVAGNVTGVAPGTALVLYVVSGCSVDTASAIFTVNPEPVAGAITGTDSVCIGHTVTLSEATTGGTWSSRISAVATIAAGVVTGATAGTDTIIYTVTNSCGSDSAAFPIKVNSCVSEVSAIPAPDDLIIYPNPANEEITIKMTEGSFSSFTITNYIGQVLMEQQLSFRETNVNIKSLPPSAMYCITFRGQNGISVQRFIKL